MRAFNIFVQGVLYNSPYVYGFTVVNKETLKDLDNDVEMIGAQIPRKTHDTFFSICLLTQSK